jgi:DNA-binding FadR family transcriptional regulator
MLEQATKTSLTDSAADKIRQEILGKRWAIGERIPNEPTLAALLGVSRGTVREAVKMLVSQDFLETRQGSGTYVRANFDPSGSLLRMRRANLRDQVETRCALEVEAARLAAIRHTPQDIQTLLNLLKLRGHSHNPQSRPGFVERDLAFHTEIVHISRNRALAETYLFFSTSVQEIIKATLSRELPEPDLDAHREIVRAIETGDPERAAATVRQFMAPILSELNLALIS